MKLQLLIKSKMLKNRDFSVFKLSLVVGILTFMGVINFIFSELSMTLLITSESGSKTYQSNVFVTYISD